MKEKTKKETFGKRRMWLCEPGDHVPHVCGAFDFNLNTPTYNDLLAVSNSISWENLSVEAFHDGREVQGPTTSKILERFQPRTRQRGSDLTARSRAAERRKETSSI